jgi:rhodanese-related sulfurtransferase
MAQALEFMQNHMLLIGGFMAVLFMIIKMEVDNNLSGVSQLNSSDAVRLMNNDKTLVVDTREASEFSAGHIKGALNIPMSEFKKRLSELEKHKDNDVLLYCRSGSRSNSACKMMRKGGFDSIHNLAGGMMGWSSANLPVTKK